jgi:membrane fusion protein (multidrug efflux system)
MSTDIATSSGEEVAARQRLEPNPPVAERAPPQSRETIDDEKAKFDRRPDPQHHDAGDKPDPQRPAGLMATLRGHPVAAIAGLVVIVAAIAAGIIWYLHARNFESSDDAFIDTRPVLISPQVSGAIVAVSVTDNQLVKAGDLLAKIDPRDYKASADQAAAQIRQAKASIDDIEAQIGTQQAQIQQAGRQVQEAQAAVNFATDENQRYQELVQKGSGTVQRAQQAESDFTSKKAALDAANAGRVAAERQVDVLRAKKEQARAQLEAAQAQKEQADANLQRTELHAPTDGRIAKLTGAVGALAAPGQAIMVLVPLDLWVTANFKETQLALMRVGQRVDIRIDAYGRTFPGRVDSIQAGSGTAFSLLPAENATGNYVKVVQRVPVKITFEQKPDVELGPGMSVVPTVTVRP